MKLMDRDLDKDHVVVMDNYFTSVPLFMELLERSTYACGTVRSNRKYLPEQFGTKQDSTWKEQILAISELSGYSLARQASSSNSQQLLGTTRT